MNLPGSNPNPQAATTPVVPGVTPPDPVVQQQAQAEQAEKPAGKTYYAWSRFPQPRENGTVKHIEPGDKVSADILGVDEDEWKVIIANGSARTQKYPTSAGSKSPAEHYRAKLAEVAQGDLDESTMAELAE